MNGSIIKDTNEFAADSLVTAHPTKKPNEVAQNTSSTSTNACKKNLSASAVSPTAKYVTIATKNGIHAWNGISMIDFEMKYGQIPYILFAYSLKNTGLSLRNVKSTENKAVIT